jgi:hypothetical protein
MNSWQVFDAGWLGDVDACFGYAFDLSGFERENATIDIKVV